MFEKQFRLEAFDREQATLMHQEQDIPNEEVTQISTITTPRSRSTRRHSRRNSKRRERRRSNNEQKHRRRRDITSRHFNQFFQNDDEWNVNEQGLCWW